MWLRVAEIELIKGSGGSRFYESLRNKPEVRSGVNQIIICVIVLEFRG